MVRVMKAVPLVVFCALIMAVPFVRANWVQDGVALCTGTSDQQYPQVISDDAGGAIVTWHDGDIYVQRVDAWGTPKWTANGVALCTAWSDQQYPQITSDGAGGAIVTWHDDRGATRDIYARRVDAWGIPQWTANGVALCTATSDQQFPTIISDGAGGAIVTWYDQRSGSWDIYAQRVNSLGAVQWATNGVALCTASGNQYDPTIVSDTAGGAYVTWHDYRSSNANIYVQRVNASGEAQWAVNGVALCTAVWDQQFPTITSDGAGGAIVTWEDERTRANDIYAQRVNATGTPLWTANGVAVCTLTGGQNSPTITSDGVGGAIITWFDNRVEYDIYAQRVNASGTAQWTANGVALCAAPGAQYYPTIVSDGAGGAIVTWHDFRSESSWDIYAQRVNPSGAVQWTADGVALCTATGNQNYPTIASGGAGGAIVTWHDKRSESWDIYAQRVDANGLVWLTPTDTPPEPTELHQNYPNPFNPATTVTYSISAECNVTLKIYDISGKCVACLVNKQQEKGSYSVEWNGRDEDGNSVASGIYLYRLEAGNQKISRKMVVLR